MAAGGWWKEARVRQQTYVQQAGSEISGQMYKWHQSDNIAAYAAFE